MPKNDVGCRQLRSSRFLALFALLSVAGLAHAQQPVPTEPQVPSKDDSKTSSPAPLTNDRIFGVIPNYRTVEDPTRGIAPLSTEQKFRIAAGDSFDYYAYPIAALFAAVGQAQNSPRSWGQGWGAYGKRFAAQFVDQTDENMMTEAVVPWLLKQDPRYFRMGQGSFWHRTGYALSRIWVTRTDTGHKAFNSSEIAGAGIAATISNAYYPSDSRSVSQTLSRWGVFVGEDTVFNILKEFWPDMRHKILKR
jgi:hypothetical protein